MTESLATYHKKEESLSPSANSLLNAAAKILSERGSIDVSLSDIARESGMNSALVKYYFGGKDGLLLALLRRDATQSIDQLQHLIDMPISAERKIRIHISGVINTYSRSPYLNRLLHYLIGNGTDASREIAGFFVEPLLNAQRAILDEGVRRGEFRKVDPELFYFSLIGACDHIFYAGHSLRHLHGHAAVTDELRQRYIAHVTEIYLAGLLIDNGNKAEAAAL